MNEDFQVDEQSPAPPPESNENIIFEKIGDEEVEVVITPSKPVPEIDPNAKDYSAVDDKITGKDIKKRINQLTAREKILEQQNAMLRDQMARAFAASDLLAQRVRSQAVENHTTTRNAVTIAADKTRESIEHAQGMLAEAVSNGDATKQAEAIKRLTRAQQEAGLVEQISLSESPEQPAEVDAYLVARQQAVQAAQQPPPQQYNPLTVEWVEQNASWFGKDQILTGLAQAIDARLPAEGYDPATPEYFQELTRRIKAVAPSAFPQTAPAQSIPGKSQFVSPVAPASRTPGENGQRRRIVATEEDHRAAKRWGISVNDLLRSRAEIEKMRGTEV